MIGRSGRRAVVVLVALAAACASGGETPRAERPGVFLEVHNANLLDADVYVVSGGQQYRLGMVTTNGRERFSIAARLIAPPGQLRVAADLLASSGSFVSQELRLEPGDVVRLFVQPDVNTSYVLLE